MKTLYLLRHAKAEREAPRGGGDFDRSLAERGRRDAAAMGRYFAARGRRPDVVLASPSQRTRETVDLFAAAWPSPIRVEDDPALYLATAKKMLARVRTLPDDAEIAMVVGHNPGMEELAAVLAGGCPAEIVKRMTRKFPTCAFAAFDVGAASWAECGPGQARLTGFVRPKDLVERDGA